jgi:hypothetical protein
MIFNGLLAFGLQPVFIFYPFSFDSCVCPKADFVQIERNPRQDGPVTVAFNRLNPIDGNAP